MLKQVVPGHAGVSRIEEDFETLKDNLILFLKQVLVSHKTQLIKRFTDLNQNNSRALASITHRINSMNSISEDLRKELNSALGTKIDETSRLEKIITGRIG